MKTVLLVEPDRDTAVLIAQYAHKHRAPFVLAHASTAQDGIHSADEHTPDVVILELAIAQHNGLAFLHELRSYPEWAHIPVIVHTSLSRDVSQIRDQDLLQLGISSYMYKPVTTLAKLIAATNGLL